MTAPTWTPCTVTLGALQPWAANPRLSTKAQAKRILASFARFGQVQAVAIGPANEVYDGHQRLSALLTVHGPDHEIDARRASRPLDDDERRALVLTLHAGATGAWNWDDLAGWDAAQLQAGGLDAEYLKTLNADAAALATMLEAEKPAPVDAEPQIDRAEELRAKWGVEPGQLWKLGEHRLICGDCTDAETIKKLMQGEAPALVIADPPYGISIVAANGYVGGGEAYDIPFGGRKVFRGSDGASKPFGSKKVRGTDGAAHVVEAGKYAPIVGDETTDTAVMSSAFYLDLYPNAAQVWWGANYYANSLPPSACWVVWDKEMTGNFADCELAWTNRDRAARLFRHRWNGMLRESERERRWHPTQKPAALAAYVMTQFTDDGAIVLDPFAGAGWAVLGAEQSNRKARAIELSADYCAVILERWAQATGGTPELVEAE